MVCIQHIPAFKVIISYQPISSAYFFPSLSRSLLFNSGTHCLKQQLVICCPTVFLGTLLSVESELHFPPAAVLLVKDTLGPIFWPLSQFSSVYSFYRILPLSWWNSAEFEVPPLVWCPPQLARPGARAPMRRGLLSPLRPGTRTIVTWPLRKSAAPPPKPHRCLFSSPDTHVFFLCMPEQNELCHEFANLLVWEGDRQLTKSVRQSWEYQTNGGGVGQNRY